jgi:Raf kinase inhibitor-like YbhB/YbcL family protein
MRQHLLLALLAVACGAPAESAEPADSSSEPATLSISSTAFAEGAPIPVEHSCEGDDVSPPLAWSGAPAGAQALALIIEDPDAPDPEAPQTIWTHWVLYDLPASASGLERAVEQLPAGTHQGNNDWGATGYRGPCPPIGEHRYFHKLYALDEPLGDLGTLDRGALLAAMEGHVLAEASLMGTYQKAE